MITRILYDNNDQVSQIYVTFGFRDTTFRDTETRDVTLHRMIFDATA